jgi:acyl-CoA reductase-like NAD-dependent aldehyde dehydrogenase
MANSSNLEFGTFHNVIDGAVSETLGRSRRVVNPSTLDNNPEVPLSTLEDVNRAVDAGKRAATAWAAVPWDERVNALQRFADAIEAVAEDFAKLVMMEQGKPVSCLPHRHVLVILEHKHNPPPS